MTEASKRNFLTLESQIFYFYVRSALITLVKNEGNVKFIERVMLCNYQCSDVKDKTLAV